MVPLHRAELGEKQKVENMSNGKEANAGHTGNGMRSTGGTITVIGNANGNIPEGGQAKCNQQWPVAIHAQGGVTPGDNRYDNKEDTIDGLKQGVIVKEPRRIGDRKQRNQPNDVEPGKNEKQCCHRILLWG